MHDQAETLHVFMPGCVTSKIWYTKNTGFFLTKTINNSSADVHYYIITPYLCVNQITQMNATQSHLKLCQ